MKIAFARPVRIVGLACGFVLALSAFHHAGSAQPPQIGLAPVHVLRNPNGTVAHGLRLQTLSGNWSGYAVRHWQTNARYTSAQASWTVPSVTYFPGFSLEDSATWVGIGGMCTDQQCDDTDHTLIQVVTVQKATASGVAYAAKYEMIPHPPVTIPVAIAPGDRVSAQVQCVAHCTSTSSKQSWALSFTDETTGAAWGPQIFTYASAELSAEWIEEAPSSEGGVLPLADFATATLNPEFGANGQTPSLTVSANGIEMRDPYGQWANPSDPNGAFNVCWDAADPAGTACPTP